MAGLLKRVAKERLSGGRLTAGLGMGGWPADYDLPGKVFDRSAPLPTGGFLNQADGTSWMAMYCLNMLQIALELEAPDRHPLRRNASELQGAAFGEGWGLYSERLADEMGLYADDHERLGMLNQQALRSARLVADTGIHAFGWTREQSIATLRASGCDEWAAAAETDRYALVAKREGTPAAVAVEEDPRG